jgi:uncharacterized OB-fold protein
MAKKQDDDRMTGEEQIFSATVNHSLRDDKVEKAENVTLYMIEGNGPDKFEFYLKGEEVEKLPVGTEIEITVRVIENQKKLTE